MDEEQLENIAFVLENLQNNTENLPDIVRHVKRLSEREPREKMSKEEALRIINKYTGSLKGIDPEKERDAYHNEKYGLVN
jgi:hypothetical protein